MIASKIKVYIAAPFFNEEQVNVVSEIEEILTENNIKFFSPRSEGKIMEMSPEEKKIKMRKIYDSNMMGIGGCNLMIAVIDGRDVGTMFELGVQASIQRGMVDERYTITFSNENFGLNVMLKFASDCHITGFCKLDKLVYNIGIEGISNSILYSMDANLEVNT